jgi:uncharacterized protein (DUF302 family)
MDKRRGGSGLKIRPSPYSVAQTAERLEQALARAGVALFAHIDHTENAAQRGLAMRPARVLIFGNPEVGTPLMRAAPTLAIDLPSKLLVWESADGQVLVAYNTARYLKERHDIRGQDDVLANLERAIAALLDDALA